MEKKSLIIHIPVIHRGYLDFFRAYANAVGRIYLFGEDLLEELAQFKPDIASLAPIEAEKLLESFGFSNVSVLSKTNLQEIEGKNLLLVQDEVSRNFRDRYAQNNKIEWATVFLRWDKSAVVSELSLNNIPISQNPFDAQIMKEAYAEAQKSGDWWRQVGAVLVQNGKIRIYAHNQDLPSDHTPYQVGEVRDFFKPGEKQDFANTIHAEQKIVAEAAKNGIPLLGTSLYATHFPCPVCAKLIACSGIKNFYFSEGASIFDGKKILESAGVVLIYIPRTY